MTRILTLATAIIFVPTAYCLSQVKGDIFARTNKVEKGFVPYTPLQERDVMWSKRIWRTLDLKEKMNHPFYFPTESYGSMQSLFNLIFTSIEKSELTVYDAIDDEFTIPLERSKALAVGKTEETFFIEDADGEMEETTVSDPPQSADVMRYRIKEDWFFDKQKSAMEVRIIGICPVLEKFDENGDYKGDQPMYWIYFPEIRPLLAQQETFNRWNDAERMNFDDLFMKRFFSSYVYKESNVYNRRITDYKTGIDALLEAEKITDKIFNLEQDLWEY